MRTFPACKVTGVFKIEHLLRQQSHQSVGCVIGLYFIAVVVCRCLIDLGIYDHAQGYRGYGYYYEHGYKHYDAFAVCFEINAYFHE